MGKGAHQADGGGEVQFLKQINKTYNYYLSERSKLPRSVDADTFQKMNTLRADPVAETLRFD